MRVPCGKMQMDHDFTPEKIALMQLGGIALFLGLLGLVIRSAVKSAMGPPKYRPPPPAYKPRDDAFDNIVDDRET